MDHLYLTLNIYLESNCDFFFSKRKMNLLLASHTAWLQEYILLPFVLIELIDEYDPFEHNSILRCVICGPKEQIKLIIFAVNYNILSYSPGTSCLRYST